MMVCCTSWSVRGVQGATRFLHFTTSYLSTIVMMRTSPTHCVLATLVVFVWLWLGRIIDCLATRNNHNQSGKHAVRGARPHHDNRAQIRGGEMQEPRTSAKRESRWRWRSVSG